MIPVAVAVAERDPKVILKILRTMVIGEDVVGNAGKETVDAAPHLLRRTPPATMRGTVSGDGRMKSRAQTDVVGPRLHLMSVGNTNGIEENGEPDLAPSQSAKGQHDQRAFTQMNGSKRGHPQKLSWPTFRRQIREWLNRLICPN